MARALPTLPKNPLIDTNVLFEFLVWWFSSDRRIPVPTAAWQYLSSDDLGSALRWCLEEARPIRTSPHVIAEIHGLIKRRLEWYGPRLSAFWRFAQEELARLRLEEHLARIVEMNGSDLEEFGPTDTSILELAARTGSAVVSEDGDLKGRLMRQEISVLGLYDILARWQEWNA